VCIAGQTCDGPPDPTQIFTRQQFAHGLTALRKRAGLTVRQVARRTGIPSGTLGDYYRGRHLPAVNHDVLSKIVRACGITDENTVREWESVLRRVRYRPAGTPYRGLEAFQPEDADWFFGRERLASTLVGELADRRDGGGLLVVVGVSGSGKSSLLRAGLIPALRRGDLGVPGSQNWPRLLCTPGDHPLKELARQLATAIRTTPVDVEGMLRSDPRAAVGLARQACGANDASDAPSAPSGPAAASPGSGARLVVVVDQFEEVFTSCPDEAERSDFIAALGAVAGGSSAEPRPPAGLVVLGLRADFYDQALRWADLLPALERPVVVGSMTESELRAAIGGPAEKEGVDLEDGLVELILRDLRPGPGTDEGQDKRIEDADPPAHEAGALPLLSHALHVTWERLQSGRMTVAEYEAGGGIRGALEQTATEAYGELTTQQKETARQLFLRLVHIADDTADTRRRVSHAELFDSDGRTQSEDLAAVLEQFVDRRLITECRDHVEIAHDSLLSAWPLLREWINADRAMLVIIRRLTQDARAWATGRDPGRLYRGNQLALAEQAGSTSPMALSQVARDFLKASVAARRRWAYVRTAVTAVMTILLAFSAVAALMAYQAEGDRREDKSRALASEAEALRVKKPYRSLLLAIEAYRIAPTTEASNSLLDLQRSYEMTPLGCGETDQTCFTDAVVAVAWRRRSKDVGVLVAAGRDGKVNVWRTSLDGSRHVHERVFNHGSLVQTAALSPDGATVVTVGQNGSIRAWDINSGKSKTLQPGNGEPVNDIAFHPKNADLVATAGDDGVVTVWSLSSAKPTVSFQADDDSLPVYAVAFSPDSRLLATGHGKGTVKLWNASIRFSAASKPFKTLLTQTAHKPARVLAFSPDSEKLAVGVDIDVLLCETADDFLKNRDGLRCSAAEGERAGPVRTLIFSPGLGNKVLTGGDKLLVGADDASVRLLYVPTLAFLSFYIGPTGNVLDVAFSPDGKTIAAAGSGKTVGLWEVQAGPEGEIGDGRPSQHHTENPDDVLDWVCGYQPTPVLRPWPESISDEFHRDIC
jgi:WD40 repeat protein/transcriptional regulator with XRE-family HTH domain